MTKETVIQDTITLRKAVFSDLNLFMEIRLEVLNAVFDNPSETELKTIAAETQAYYENTADHDTFFAFDGDEFAACGSICYYQVLPVCRNSSGHKAFIMNMYTRPAYRRRGISCLILEHLIEEAKSRGIHYIHLDASEAGSHVYSKYGFIRSQDEMYLVVK